MVDNAIMEFAPARNAALARSLVSLEDAIRAAATASLQEVLDQDSGYSETEKQAMITVEALKQVNGLDLMAILIRGKLLKEIEEHNMVTSHPGGYHSLSEMAIDQGISLTELSQTKDLCFIVFPYIEEHLGITIATLWEGMGKSNIKELLPVLKQIITNDLSGTETVRSSVETILDDVAATARAAGQELDDAGIRRTAIDQLIDAGLHLHNRELRHRIRPDGTPNINATLLGTRDHRIMVTEMSEEQWTMMQRKMGEKIDVMSIELPEDPYARQIEATRVPELRALMDFLRGN